MKILLSVLFTALAVHSTQACRSGMCDPFCAGEVKDPSKKLTFYSEEALAAFNKNFEGDEKFVYVHNGKCVYDEDCCEYEEVEICTIPEPGASGYPQTFKNFCELNRFNCENPENEYLYYHDDCCNDLDDATPSSDECDCLNCDDEPRKPVCAYPTIMDQAQPVSFSNYCSLQKFNCEAESRLNSYMYWHDDACLNDPLPR